MIGDNELEFIEGNEELLDLIGPLWDKLNHHHVSVSTYFSNQFAKFSFQKRRKGIKPGEDGKLIRIDLVRVVTENKLVGYCFSSVVKGHYGITGEIESLYIEPEYRGIGIGSRFMHSAMDWMDQQGIDRKMVVVATGNEEVYEFYRRFGFYPKSTRLEQKRNAG